MPSILVSLIFVTFKLSIVEVTFIFVGVINLFMFVLVSSLIGETENMLFNGAIALDFCVRLFVLSYVSESLGKKVKFSSVLFF